MCGAVYYIQIRKSEQRPPLHLRTADLVPQPRTPLCHTRARQQTRHREAPERVYEPTVDVCERSYLARSESLIHPNVHRGPPTTRARWRPEAGLAGVVEQHLQSTVRKLGRTRLRRGTDAGRRTRRVADTSLRATDAPVR